MVFRENTSYRIILWSSTFRTYENLQDDNTSLVLEGVGSREIVGSLEEATDAGTDTTNPQSARVENTEKMPVEEAPAEEMSIEEAPIESDLQSALNTKM